MRSAMPHRFSISSANSGTRFAGRAAGGEQLPPGVAQRFDVARRPDAPGAVAPHELAEPGDVVDHGRYARTERLQERPRLVELGAVREDGDGRLRERSVELI